MKIFIFFEILYNTCYPGTLGIFADNGDPSLHLIDNSGGNFSALHNVEFSDAVPEPSSWALLAIALTFLVRTRR